MYVLIGRTLHNYLLVFFFKFTNYERETIKHAQKTERSEDIKTYDASRLLKIIQKGEPNFFFFRPRFGSVRFVGLVCISNEQIESLNSK